MSPEAKVADFVQDGGGALNGIRVLEFAGLGPVPFTAMLLGDHGADVIRVERPGADFDEYDPIQRNRRSIVLDLKFGEGQSLVEELVRKADVLLEGFRPGVMERLGLGPDRCLELNEGLVYGRLSGWGRDGDMAAMPGRDINYLALTGILAALGTSQQPPPPPLNAVGDYGGGAMSLAIGVLMALLARASRGRGQVVDCSILGGATMLTAWVRGQLAAGRWAETREDNLLDGGAPFYRCYQCSDDRWVAVGALDPGSYAELLDGLGVPQDDTLRLAREDRSLWTQAVDGIAGRFLNQTRDEWTERFRRTGACVTPVLSFSEASEEPQNWASAALARVNGIVQPAACPTFSSTPSRGLKPPCRPGSDTRAVLQEIGIASAHIDELYERGVVA